MNILKNKRMHMMIGVMVLCMFLCLEATGWTAIYNAVPDQTDTDCSDQTCWLQSALDEAENNGEADEIRLTQGTYYPPSSHGFSYDSDQGFHLKVKGGYDTAFETQTLNPDNTIIDGQNEMACLNLKQHDGGKIYVEGLTIQNSKWWNLHGLSLMTEVKTQGRNADITVYKNIIQNNVRALSVQSHDYTDAGLISGTIIVAQNIIRDNTEYGGLHLNTSSNYGVANEIHLLSNQILRNSSSSVNYANIIRTDAQYPGSVAKKMTVQDNYIYGNEAVSGGGLKLVNDPGYGQGEEILVEANLVLSNQAGQGGGILIDTRASSTAGVSGGGVSLLNNVFAKNTSTTHAGGLWIKCSNTTHLGTEAPRYLINNTITENDGGDWTNANGVLLSARPDSVYHVYNNIIWGNNAGGTNPFDLYIWATVNGTAHVYNNDYSSFHEEGTVNKGSSIDQDPLFTSATSDNFRLQSASQCIDSGDNAAPMLPAVDIEDTARVADGDGDTVSVVDMGAYEYALPEAATLISPSGDITDTTPTYTWNAVTGATWYRLYVRKGSTGNVHDKWYQASNVTSGSTCSITPSTTLNSGDHTWWIRTYNAYGYGPWSNGMNFTVGGDLPEAATLISPSGTISETSPIFTWNAVASATWYRLYVREGSSGSVIDTWYQASNVTSGSTCSVTPGTTLDSGDHTWWIRTYNAYGYGPWSNGMNFTVGGDLPEAATLISPSGTISETSPTFTWNAVATATWYRLYVREGSSGSVIDTWYQASNVTSGSTCSVTPSTTLNSEDHTWWIQTYNAYGYGPWSDSMDFTVSQ